MKIIDLLNKIANGEEVPKKIRFEGKIYEKQNETSFYCIGFGIFEQAFVLEDLNKEVEIIEEDKEIKKSDFQYSEIPPYFDLTEVIKSCNNNFEKHQKAINKILDYLMEEK